MMERLLVVLALLALTVGIALIVRKASGRRAAGVVGREVPALLRARLPDHGPTLVYFYGPHCATCADQANALDELAREGQATVVAVDATRERVLADSLGARMVPTTALLDASGRVRQVNLGYHPKSALLLQLAAVSATL